MSAESKTPDPREMTDEEGWEWALKMMVSLNERITELEYEVAKK